MTAPASKRPSGPDTVRDGLGQLVGPDTAEDGDPGLADYRLEDLVSRSGVSARNIRSYQERGLLQPPRREGRVAIYDENHLAQLQIITQLLQKGFSISHIQDFFEGFAKNLDLADILGIQELAKETGLHQALTGPWAQVGPGARRAKAGTTTAPLTLAVDPASKVARTLVKHGVAQQQGTDVVIRDPDIAAVLAGFKDQAFGLRILADVCDATVDTVQELAEATINEVSKNLIEQYGEGWIPPVEEQEELGVVITDARELAGLVLDRALRMALRENGIRAIGEYMEGIMAAQGGESAELLKAMAANLRRG